MLLVGAKWFRWRMSPLPDDFFDRWTNRVTMGVIGRLPPRSTHVQGEVDEKATHQDAATPRESQSLPAVTPGRRPLGNRFIRSPSILGIFDLLRGYGLHRSKYVGRPQIDWPRRPLPQSLFQVFR